MLINKSSIEWLIPCNHLRKLGLGRHFTLYEARSSLDFLVLVHLLKMLTNLLCFLGSVDLDHTQVTSKCQQKY